MTNNKCMHHYMHHIAKSNKDVLKSAVKIVTFNGKNMHDAKCASIIDEKSKIIE